MCEGWGARTRREEHNATTQNRVHLSTPLAAFTSFERACAERREGKERAGEKPGKGELRGSRNLSVSTAHNTNWHADALWVSLWLCPLTCAICHKSPVSEFSAQWLMVGCWLTPSFYRLCWYQTFLLIYCSVIFKWNACSTPLLFVVSTLQWFNFTWSLCTQVTCGKLPEHSLTAHKKFILLYKTVVFLDLLLLLSLFSFLGSRILGQDPLLVLPYFKQCLSIKHLLGAVGEYKQILTAIPGFKWLTVYF